MLTDLEKLRLGLLVVGKKKKDAYLIIGAVSGYPEKRVREIAEGKGDIPTTVEVMSLSSILSPNLPSPE